jgi:hypothetical protein
MLDQFKSLIPTIKQRLADHHRLYPIIKVKYDLWEYVLAAAIDDVFPQYEAQWNYGSQQIGRDITLNDGVRISCKSGQIHSDGRIKISSSRLSRFSDDEKIKAYLCSTKTEDYILCLSTLKGETSTFDGEPQYLYSIYDAGIFDYANMRWELFGKDDNLRGHHRSGVTVTCTKAMGWQIWYYLPINLALYHQELHPTRDNGLPMTLPVYRPAKPLVAADLLGFF